MTRLMSELGHWADKVLLSLVSSKRDRPWKVQSARPFLKFCWGRFLGWDAGSVRGEHWEFVHRKIPQSQEKREERGSWSRLLQLGRSVLSNVWTESASGLPQHQCEFYTNSSSTFKLLTSAPPPPDTSYARILLALLAWEHRLLTLI